MCGVESVFGRRAQVGDERLLKWSSGDDGDIGRVQNSSLSAFSVSLAATEDFCSKGRVVASLQ